LRRGLPVWLRAGPDADLGHLPLSLDLRAVSIAEGVRAALAVAVVVTAAEWFHIPALAAVSLGSLLTCLCDPGGPIRRRLPALFTFTLLGSAAFFVFSLLRAAGVLPGALGGAAWVFCAMFARAWGPVAMQVGNLLTVVAILALDHGEDLQTAALLSALFAAGALWALLLSLVIWRLHPFRPARLAAADVYDRIAVLAADLSEQVAGAAVPDWSAHARAHRRYVRDGLEAARAELLDILRSRGQGGPRGNALVIQVEAADQIFGAVIAVSDILEHGGEEVAMAARPILPALRLVLAGISDGIVTDHAEDAGHRAMFLRLFAEIERAGQTGPLAEVAHSLVSVLRVAALMTTPEGRSVEGASESDRTPALTRLTGPLRANLQWSSASLRHAVRATAVALPALLITLPVGAVYAHWLTITLILTLQPFFALTWQRALERVGGTVLGGLVAACLSIFVHSPALIAACLFPLAVIAFAIRRVSFGLFMAALTPLIVLLSELGQPGTGEVAIALYRAGYTLAGGAMAVAGGLLLWPSWEPARVQGDLLGAIRAHGAYAEAELAALIGKAPPGSAETARRGAGLASNNLETTLSRALQEPGHASDRELQVAMVADAALRRIAGRLAALQHAPGLAGSAEMDRWREWLTASFAALASGSALPGGMPADPDNGPLGRIARQLVLIDGALRPGSDSESARQEPRHEEGGTAEPGHEQEHAAARRGIELADDPDHDAGRRREADRG